MPKDQISGLNREVLRRQTKALQDQRAIDHVQVRFALVLHKL